MEGNSTPSAANAGHPQTRGPSDYLSAGGEATWTRQRAGPTPFCGFQTAISSSSPSVSFHSLCGISYRRGSRDLNRIFKAFRICRFEVNRAKTTAVELGPNFSVAPCRTCPSTLTGNKGLYIMPCQALFDLPENPEPPVLRCPYAACTYMRVLKTKFCSPTVRLLVRT